MAGYWEGFSEKDIGFYIGLNEVEEKDSAPKREANKLQGRNVRGVIRSSNKNHSKVEQMAIPEDAKLTKNAQEEMPLVEEVPESETKNEEEMLITGTSQAVCLKLVEGNGYEVLEREPKMVSPAALEVFQARQKVLEEQNKRRKEMLAKVLDDRRKKTTEEAIRLKKIQDELHKLDLILSNDVGILRDQIENASIEFGEAQKRYNKAEKEYLDAKQTLFNKLERKEMLTKHLCTIIEQNEMRKAQKLSELMEKLRINENNTDTSSGLNTVILSPYYESALSDKERENKSDEKSGNLMATFETEKRENVKPCS